MTSIAHRYTDFGAHRMDGQIVDPVPVEHVEDQKLQAFEEGYQAGWTDAEKNHASEHKTLGEEMLKDLRNQALTYQDALARLNRGLKPMFEQIMMTLLPKTASTALRAHVIEQLVALSATQTQAQITVRVSEPAQPMIEELLDDAALKLPVSVCVDPTLSPHQMFVSLDMVEREINLDAVCSEITAAMTAFNFHSQTEHSDA